MLLFVVLDRHEYFWSELCGFSVSLKVASHRGQHLDNVGFVWTGVVKSNQKSLSTSKDIKFKLDCNIWHFLRIRSNFWQQMYQKYKLKWARNAFTCVNKLWADYHNHTFADEIN